MSWHLRARTAVTRTCVCICINVYTHSHLRAWWPQVCVYIYTCTCAHAYTHHMYTTRSMYTQTIAPDSTDLIIMYVYVCIWKWLLQAQLCECVGVHVYTVFHGTVHWGNSPVLFWRYDFILKAAGHWWCISVCGGLGVGVGGVMPGLALFLSKHFAVL